MKFLSKCKDGGPESTVWGYFLCEIKSLFSIVLLRFENGSRDAFHSHAFNCVSWVLKGQLVEEIPPKCQTSGPCKTSDNCSPLHFSHFNVYEPSFRPVFTYRSTTHKVVSQGRTWVISFRGPWAKTWKEIVPGEGEINLTDGRKRVY